MKFQAWIEELRGKDRNDIDSILSSVKVSFRAFYKGRKDKNFRKAAKKELKKLKEFYDRKN